MFTSNNNVTNIFKDSGYISLDSIMHYQKMTSNQETLVSQNTLELIRKNQELRRQTSKYVKVLEGETRIFTFNAEAIESYVSEKFNTLRFRYEVIEFGNTGPQYWEVSKTVSEQIDNLLVAGHTKLKVHRIGADKRTVYIIDPAAED